MGDFLRNPTYDIMQDVQYHNGVEITSVMFDGVRYYRAYSLFDAAVPGIDKKTRTQLVVSAGRKAVNPGGSVRMQRWKSGGTWFLSLDGLEAAYERVANYPASGRYGPERQRDACILGHAVELAHVLHGMSCEKTAWPVRLANDWPVVRDWVVNTNTGTYHFPDCSAVRRIPCGHRLDARAACNEMSEKYKSCRACRTK